METLTHRKTHTSKVIHWVITSRTARRAVSKQPIKLHWYQVCFEKRRVKLVSENKAIITSSTTYFSHSRQRSERKERRERKKKAMLRFTVYDGRERHLVQHLRGFPGGSDGKESACNAVWSMGWEGPLEKGTATHSSILAWRNPMGRRAWWAIVHRVTNSQTQLTD